MFSSIIPVVLFTLSTAVAAKDCTSSSAAQSANAVQDQTICLKDGSERSYTIYLPESYSSADATAHPLILSYHGGSKTPEDQIALDLLTTSYFNKDAIVVYPAGIDVCLLQSSGGVKS
jgi:poly(3-hydroxybutyrate) depolymerase